MEVFIPIIRIFSPTVRNCLKMVQILKQPCLIVTFFQTKMFFVSHLFSNFIGLWHFFRGTSSIVHCEGHFSCGFHFNKSGVSGLLGVSEIERRYMPVPNVKVLLKMFGEYFQQQDNNRTTVLVKQTKPHSCIHSFGQPLM